MPQSDLEASPPPTPGWVGRTFPSGLTVHDSLGETPDGELFAATYPTGLEVVLLIPRYRRDRLADAVALAEIRERVLHAIDLKHPNVAEVYATGETADGWLYIVLESLDGEPMSRMIATRGTIPVPEAVDLTRQACGGLQAAHALGIVHGNLSPYSLLIVRELDGRPRVKVSGFSLTPSPPGRAADTLEKAGPDPRYASPERLEGRTPDPRSDVYSLGAVLHHLVAGVPPGPAVPAASVSSTMRTILSQALARAPLERFQSMHDFADALERAGHGLDRPGNRWAGRRWYGVAAAVILVAAVGYGLLRRSDGRLGIGPAQQGVQESGRMVVADRDSAPRLVEPKRKARPSPPRVAIPPAPEAAARAPARTHSMAPAAVPRPTPPAPPDSNTVVSRATPDSAPTKVSPFRRSHPWAAAPGGKYYYRSSCPAALRRPDLIFFTTEAEARAQGFLPGPVAGCS